MESGFLCKGITKQYQDFKLDNISFELPAGYVLGVIGRNGCGKSTLLRALLGWFPKSEGDALIGDKSLKLNGREYKSELAYVLNECPFDAMNTAEQIGLEYGKYYRGFDRKKYRKLLDEFGINRKKWISNLSQGQQMRVQIAFAMSYDATVYIFDEPAGNLDVEFRNEFYAYVREVMKDGGKNVICSSHLIEELEEIADYIMWMKRDDNLTKVFYYGTADELKENYRMLACDRETAEAIAKIAKQQQKAFGGRTRDTHSEMLFDKALLENEEFMKLIAGNTSVRYADLKEIMYYLEKGELV